MPTAENPNAIVPGLFAAGEAACASVHGANRLGTHCAVLYIFDTCQIMQTYSQLSQAECCVEIIFL